MKVQVKKLHKDAVIPFYSKEGDAGMDLTAVSVDYTHEHYISYKTGLAIKVPKGYMGLIFPRSSVSNKTLLLSNSVGVLDSGYVGEVELRFKRVYDNYELQSDYYTVGDRVGQLIIIPYPHIEMEEVEELPITSRGEGGFGSTGL